MVLLLERRDWLRGNFLESIHHTKSQVHIYHSKYYHSYDHRVITHSLLPNSYLASLLAMQPVPILDSWSPESLWRWRQINQCSRPRPFSYNLIPLTTQADAVLVDEQGGQHPVHSFLLALKIPLFRSLGKIRHVVMAGVSSDVVELIVGMVYGHDELRFHPPSAELELILPDLGLSWPLWLLHVSFRAN